MSRRSKHRSHRSKNSAASAAPAGVTGEIPDVPTRRNLLKYILIAAAFLAWAGFLIYCGLAGGV
ncbi:MAG: hypothetical protein ACYTF6_00810 [Planctomycetota bacterium]